MSNYKLIFINWIYSLIGLTYLLIPRTMQHCQLRSTSGPMCWSSLPPQLKSASEQLILQLFCDRLKTVLFSRSYT